MFSFFRKSGSGHSARRPVELVPCPHCGIEIPASSAACKHCGYDGEADLDQWDEEGYADDDFDYEEYVQREFGDDELGDRQTSGTLTTWQRAVAVVVIIAFILTLFGPLLF